MYPNSHNQIGARDGTSINRFGAIGDTSPATPSTSPVSAKIMKMHGQLDVLNTLIDKAIDASMPGLCSDPRQVPCDKSDSGPPSTCPLEGDLDALSRRLESSISLISSLASSIRL